MEAKAQGDSARWGASMLQIGEEVSRFQGYKTASCLVNNSQLPDACKAIPPKSEHLRGASCAVQPFVVYSCSMMIHYQ